MDAREEKYPEVHCTQPHTIPSATTLPPWMWHCLRSIDMTRRRTAAVTGNGRRRRLVCRGRRCDYPFIAALHWAVKPKTPQREGVAFVAHVERAVSSARDDQKSQLARLRPVMRPVMRTVHATWPTKSMRLPLQTLLPFFPRDFCVTRGAPPLHAQTALPLLHLPTLLISPTRQSPRLATFPNKDLTGNIHVRSSSLQHGGTRSEAGGAHIHGRPGPG